MPRLSIAACLTLTLLAGCTSHSANADPAMRGLNSVRHANVLSAAYIDYPPSMTVDPNSKAKGGIMPEVISEAASAMGVKVDYVEETTFGSMVDTLDNGRADIVVSGIWPSSSRALR